MKEQIEELSKSIDEALVHNVSWNSQNGVIAYSADGIARELFDDGYRKQEWISVDDRLPEDVYGKDRKIITVLVCTKSGRVSTSSRVRMMMLNKEKRDFEYTDIFEWSGQIAKKITHWMPLPEPPKMKGGE